MGFVLSGTGIADFNKDNQTGFEARGSGTVAEVG
jgi:hypothetical protein